MDIVPILIHPPTQIWINLYIFCFFIEPFPNHLFIQKNLNPTNLAIELTPFTCLSIGIADPPSPSKPGSMEDAIKLWLKIGNIEKLQVCLQFNVLSK